MMATTMEVDGAEVENDRKSSNKRLCEEEVCRRDEVKRMKIK